MSRSFPLTEYSTVVRMTVQDVVNWLSENRLSDCVKKFREASVDGNKLIHITLPDLRGIKVSKNDASTILNLVGQVRKPNDKRGQVNVAQNNARNASVNEESDDDGGWDSSDFEDFEEDDLAPQAPPRPGKNRALGLPPPPSQKTADQLPVRKAPAPIPQEEPQDTYEDPYQSRYPGHNHAPPVPSQPIPPRRRDPEPVQEELYEDPDEPKVPERRNHMPLPSTPRTPPREPPRSRAPAPVPAPAVEEQEVYEDVEQDVPKISFPKPPFAGRNLPPVPQPTFELQVYEIVHDEESNKLPQTPAPAKPPRQPAHLPEQEDYEEVDEKPQPMSSRNVHSQPPRSRAPPPLPTQPPVEQEEYEIIPEKPAPASSRNPTTAPPISRNPPTQPPRSRQPAPVPPQPEPEQEVYEDMDDNNTEPQPPARNTGIPPRRGLPGLPPTPAVPEEDDNYLDMEETVDSAPPLPTRPPLRSPNPRHMSSDSDSDSDVEDYLEPEFAPPLPKQAPKQEKPAPKRELPAPPGVPGYTKVDVTSKGTPVINGTSKATRADTPSKATRADTPSKATRADTPSKDTTNKDPKTQASTEGYLDNQRFYHGEISRDEADDKLMQHRVDGMYLIRKSTKNPAQPYTLQLYFQGNTFNLPVYKNNGQFHISNEKSKEFGTVLEMVNHFKQVKLILKGGKETFLKKSVPKS